MGYIGGHRSMKLSMTRTGILDNLYLMDVGLITKSLGFVKGHFIFCILAIFGFYKIISWIVSKQNQVPRRKQSLLMQG